MNTYIIYFFGLAIFLGGVYTYILYLKYKNYHKLSEWFNTLVSTFVSVILAISSGLFIYGFQQDYDLKNERQTYKNLLLDYTINVERLIVESSKHVITYDSAETVTYQNIPVIHLDCEVLILAINKGLFSTHINNILSEQVSYINLFNSQVHDVRLQILSSNFSDGNQAVKSMRKIEDFQNNVISINNKIRYSFLSNDEFADTVNYYVDIDSNDSMLFPLKIFPIAAELEFRSNFDLGYERRMDTTIFVKSQFLKNYKSALENL